MESINLVQKAVVQQLRAPEGPHHLKKNPQCQSEPFLKHFLFGLFGASHFVRKLANAELCEISSVVRVNAVLVVERVLSSEVVDV